jgi:hypothetical protein
MVATQSRSHWGKPNGEPDALKLVKFPLEPILLFTTRAVRLGRGLGGRVKISQGTHRGACAHSAIIWLSSSLGV